MSNFLDLEGLTSYHSKLKTLLSSLSSTNGILTGHYIGDGGKSKKIVIPDDIEVHGLMNAECDTMVTGITSFLLWINMPDVFYHNRAMAFSFNYDSVMGNPGTVQIYPTVSVTLGTDADSRFISMDLLDEGIEDPIGFNRVGWTNIGYDYSYVIF